MGKRNSLDAQDGISIEDGQLGRAETIITDRPDGSRRIQRCFKNVPSRAEQHTAHLTDINYLMKKYKPDELAAYLAVRSQHKKVIEGHDFSQEPNLQDAKNVLVQSKNAFEELSDDLKSHFSSHIEFLKFIDNPENQKKLVRMGLINKKQIDKIVIPESGAQTVPGDKKGSVADDKKAPDVK